MITAGLARLVPWIFLLFRTVNCTRRDRPRIPLWADAASGWGLADRTVPEYPLRRKRADGATPLYTGMHAKETAGQSGFPQEWSVAGQRAGLYAAPDPARAVTKGRLAGQGGRVYQSAVCAFRKRSAALTYPGPEYPGQTDVPGRGLKRVSRAHAGRASAHLPAKPAWTFAQVMFLWGNGKCKSHDGFAGIRNNVASAQFAVDTTLYRGWG
jgi:hypothetical protein